MKRLKAIVILAAIVLHGTPPASAQNDRQLTQSKSDTTEKRLALVIGNGAYRNAPRLANPVNDATDMAEVLRGLGFEVLFGKDQSADEMKKLITEFGTRLAANKGVGLFFYAGHGVQVSGKNFLIPVEADQLKERTIEYEAVDVGRVLAQMEDAGSRLNIVILDACRSNPFERSWRSDDRGLAEIKAPTGTLIAYATAPGKVASDGTGRNGLFTGELIKKITTPNVMIETLFKRVGESVSDLSKGTQEPYLSLSIRGDFYFVKSDAPVAVTPKPTPLPTPTPVAAVVGITASEEEEQVWQRVTQSDTRSDYEFYMREYPKGKHYPAAAQRIEQFKQAEIQRQKDAERAVWATAERQNTRESYNAYLSAYPNGTYVADARAGIKALDARDEQSKWDASVLLNRKSAYQSYLSEYPNGKYAVQARGKIKEFEDAEAAAEKARQAAAEKAKWEEAERLNTVAAYQAYLKAYPEGAYSKLAKFNLSKLGVVLTIAAGTVKKSPTGIELVWIPPGEFMMGSTLAEIEQAWAECKKYLPECERKWFEAEAPRHKVTIREGFWMGRYEVTQGEWQSVMASNPSYFNECGPTCPVEGVSWDDIQEFLRRLSLKDSEFEFSLPSEARWEYAARAGTITAFAFGSIANSKLLNFNSEAALDAAVTPFVSRTVPVGSYRPNAWGLHDMHGNVSEWVEDVYNEAGYSGLAKDGSANLKIGNAKKRVLRGGSCADIATLNRSAFRYPSSESGGTFLAGFRVLARPR